MTGRASVWSNPRVIELSKQFVTATDEVWRLQQGDDAECVFFQEMADHGHYGGRPGASRQGIYVCAPSGRFLASINSNNPDRVLAMMERGLAAWSDLSEEERRLDADSEVAPEHRWEDSFPMGGLVLTMITRDLPIECRPELECSPRWNQDYVWFSADEARQFLPESIEVDAEYELPSRLALRFAQFHLVDTVNGQTTPFDRRDIEQASILVKVVDARSEVVRIELTGNTASESDARRRRESRHGVQTDLRGYAEFDLINHRFTQFEMVAIGTRWGHTTYNGRRRETPPSPVGFVYRMATESDPVIAPAFIYSYNAAWVTRRSGD